MANSNFVVHNGLQVGPLTINAATGDISTSGNISVTGPLGTNKISVDASNVTVTSSFVNVAVNGTNVAAFSSASASLTGYLNVTGNVLGAAGTLSTLGINSTTAATSSSTGALIVAGGIGVAKNSVFGENVTIVGNLSVNGTQTIFNSNTFSVNDALIYLADDNGGDVLDIGVVSSFTNGGYQHTGLVRDASDGVWKLFAGVADEPTTTVNFTSATYSTLQTGGITLPSITHNGTNGVGDIGQSGQTFATVYATTFAGVSTTAKYADLAENYQADQAYEPGTVLMFGGENEVTLADEGTHRVAGVVSTNPAHLMNTGLVGDNVVALALQGRVPVKVTGYIQKGDMMISAGNGFARASAMPQVGCVIGKSLENFDGAEGVIEVVVGRV